MKKLVAIILASVLVCCMMLPVLAEEYDLSGISWDDLIALRNQVNRELMSRDQWQSVEVPQGVYRVGESIPAGKWTITCDKWIYSVVSFGSELDDSKQHIAYSGDVYEDETIYNPNGDLYKDGHRVKWDIELLEGQYVVISVSSAIFTTYTGKPDLGFK